MPLCLLAMMAVLALPAAARAEADPLEAANRRVHAFNALAQAHVLGPVADYYAAVTPAPVQAGLRRAVANLGEPLTAASSLAAADTDVAGRALLRFGINLTLGWGGWRDRAAEMGYPRIVMRPADTLCRWGVPAGPFLVLPLLGPSNLRDASAMAATAVALSDVLGTDAALVWGTVEAALAYADARPELARIERHSLDAYAVMRSAYRQRRAAVCPVDVAALE